MGRNCGGCFTMGEELMITETEIVNILSDYHNRCSTKGKFNRKVAKLIVQKIEEHEKILSILKNGKYY